jgi:heterodisulfide reductase subunit C2
MEAVLKPDFRFLEEVESHGPFEAAACYQCRKCTNGCPVTFAMDLYPDQVIRKVILGQRDEVLRCSTIWVCATCETCTTRCPNDVKIAEIMDCLKEMATRQNISVPQPQVRTLHQAFLKNIRRHGRVFEGELMAEYLIASGQLMPKFKDGTLMDDVKLGINLLRKGKMSVIPKIHKGRKFVSEVLKD